jgi:hypothetical protein
MTEKLWFAHLTDDFPFISAKIKRADGSIEDIKIVFAYDFDNKITLAIGSLIICAINYGADVFKNYDEEINKLCDSLCFALLYSAHILNRDISKFRFRIINTIANRLDYQTGNVPGLSIFFSKLLNDLILHVFVKNILLYPNYSKYCRELGLSVDTVNLDNIHNEMICIPFTPFLISPKIINGQVVTLNSFCLTASSKLKGEIIITLILNNTSAMISSTACATDMVNFFDILFHTKTDALQYPELFLIQDE